MNISHFNARTFASLAVAVAAFASGCAAEPAAAPSDNVMSTAQNLTLIDPNGAELPVTLLPGSTGTANGDAQYLVRVLERELQVSRVAGTEGSDYLEVFEGATELGKLELGADSMTLETPDGRSLYSAAPMLPAREALALVEPVALTLLDARSIDAFDAVLFAATSGRDGIGVSRQALSRAVAGTCPGASCTNSVAPLMQTCCCNVGDRCVSTTNTCYCEPATRFGGSVGAAIAH